MKPEHQCLYVCQPPGDTKEDKRRPEIGLKETETNGKTDDQLVMCGYVPVVLSKMFGPMIFADLRIRADAKTCEWVIERESIDCKWTEFCRIPGQVAEDFNDQEQTT